MGKVKTNIFLNAYVVFGALFKGHPRWHSGKEFACQCKRCKRSRFDPWVGKSPWRRKWQPPPIVLPGELCGQRSLVGYSPWACQELGMSKLACTHGLLKEAEDIGLSPSRNLQSFRRAEDTAHTESGAAVNVGVESGAIVGSTEVSASTLQQ